jgi:hypothetical protein
VTRRRNSSSPARGAETGPHGAEDLVVDEVRRAAGVMGRPADHDASRAASRLAVSIAAICGAPGVRSAVRERQSGGGTAAGSSTGSLGHPPGSRAWIPGRRDRQRPGLVEGRRRGSSSSSDPPELAVSTRCAPRDYRLIVRSGHTRQTVTGHVLVAGWCLARPIRGEITRFGLWPGRQTYPRQE